MKTTLRLIAATLLAGSATLALAQPAPQPAPVPGAPCTNCQAPGAGMPYRGGPGMHHGGPGMHHGGPGMHHGGPGMHHRGAAMDPAQREARMQARVDALKAQLKLTPAQQPAWDALAAKMKAQAEARRTQFADMQALRGDPQKMLEFRAEMMKRNGEQLSEIAAARAALVAQLSPEQKTTLDQARSHFMGEYRRGARQTCGQPA